MYLVFTTRERLPPIEELEALGSFEVMVSPTARLRELYLEELAASGERDDGFLAVLDACDTKVVMIGHTEQETIAARVAAISLGARCDGWFSDPQVGGPPVRCR